MQTLDGADPTVVREHLLKHAKSKLNGVFSPNADRVVRKLNPICGDQVELRARLKDDRLTDLGYSAKACAICSASASIVTQVVNEMSRSEIAILREAFFSALVDPPSAPWPESLRAFEAFAHLRINPRRRACAVLPWLALSDIN